MMMASSVPSRSRPMPETLVRTKPPTGASARAKFRACNVPVMLARKASFSVNASRSASQTCRASDACQSSRSCSLAKVTTTR